MRRPRATGRLAKARGGFALVEVLAALALTALLVGAVLPWAGQLMARWWTGAREVERADAVMQTIARLADDVSQVAPISEPGRARPTRDFAVTASSLDLVRPALGASAGLRLDFVAYRVVRGEGGDRLVRLTAPFAGEGDAAALAGGSQAGDVLLAGPYRIAFAAIGSAGMKTEWQDQAALPAAVRFTLRPLDRSGPPTSILDFRLGAGGG